MGLNKGVGINSPFYKKTAYQVRLFFHNYKYLNKYIIINKFAFFIIDELMILNISYTYTFATHCPADDGAGKSQKCDKLFQLHNIRA